MALRICAKCGKVVPRVGVTYAGKIYHKECFVCAYCGGPIQRFVEVHDNAFYHPECKPASGLLICAYCRKPITGSSYRIDDKYYHEQCYHQHLEKTCCICGEVIHSRYFRDPWGNYSHDLHDGRKPSFCYACGRIIAGGSWSLGKDAELCAVCAPAAITTDAAVEECRRKVISVFRQLRITGVPENIPVALVPKGQMNGHLGDIRYYKVRDPQRADFHIRMTYGLPDLYFRGVLAHEMLHSWLALYGRQVTKDECEGFCNLGEAFVYTMEDTPLAHYLLKQMYKNADAVYGDGYRLQKQRYERLGWEGLLKSLRYKQEP